MKTISSIASLLFVLLSPLFINVSYGANEIIPLKQPVESRPMKITFIYNAKSGKINTFMDIGHKILNPDTYSCNLCSLTYGVFTEKEEWKKYRENSSFELIFFHKDEFEKKYKGNEKFTYPIILKSETDGIYEVLVPTQKINELNGISELIEILPKK
ncbi:MAG TPA: hypothetical protein QF753_18745 [Victivallales bacterium]|nr:hypothetical protein [Victivallales bacterium]